MACIPEFWSAASSDSNTTSRNYFNKTFPVSENVPMLSSKEDRDAANYIEQFVIVGLIRYWISDIIPKEILCRIDFLRFIEIKKMFNIHVLNSPRILEHVNERRLNGRVFIEMFTKLSGIFQQHTDTSIQWYPMAISKLCLKLAKTASFTNAHILPSNIVSILLNNVIAPAFDHCVRKSAQTIPTNVNPSYIKDTATGFYHALPLSDPHMPSKRFFWTFSEAACRVCCFKHSLQQNFPDKFVTMDPVNMCSPEFKDLFIGYLKEYIALTCNAPDNEKLTLRIYRLIGI